MKWSTVLNEVTRSNRIQQNALLSTEWFAVSLKHVLDESSVFMARVKISSSCIHILVFIFYIIYFMPVYWWNEKNREPEAVDDVNSAARKLIDPAKFPIWNSLGGKFRWWKLLYYTVLYCTVDSVSSKVTLILLLAYYGSQEGVGGVQYNGLDRGESILSSLSPQALLLMQR